jgi:hypothetical protein
MMPSKPRRQISGESYALTFDVLREDASRTVALLNQFIHAMLAFDEWRTPQIFTVEPQHAESIEHGLHAGISVH